MCLIISSVLLLVSAQTPDAPEPDIAGILDTLFAAIEDVSFDYEGSFVTGLPDDAKGADSPSAKIKDTFSGKFSFRRDGATRVESYHHRASSRKPGQTELVMSRIATLAGRKTEYTEQEGRPGSVQTKEGIYHDYFKLSSPGRIFLVGYLRGFARYPRKRVIHEGQSIVDGHTCEVFSFVTGKDYEKGPTGSNSVQRFYLDFERGGHPIKVEWLVNSRLWARIVDIRLQQFASVDGRKVWLPVSGRYEALTVASKDPKAPLISVGYPTSRDTIAVLAGSVRVNAALTDEHFRIKCADSTVVLDGVTGRAIGRGRRREVARSPVNVAEAEERLRGQIQEAEAQGKELKASSAARGAGWGSVTWIPWSVAFLMALALVLLLFRSRVRVADHE